MAATDSHERQTDTGFIKLCAILAMAGYALMILGNIVGSIVVPGHDPVADTISDLGAGEYEIIQDVAFYAYAGGLLVLALGLAHVHQGGWRWTLGIFAIVVLAGLTVVIGARNEYGDGDNEGVVIHIYLVYGLSLMLLAAPLLLWQGLKNWSDLQAKCAVGFAILWLITSPVFFFMPTAYDGAWERGLGLLATAWLAVVTAGLWSHSGDNR
jgi:hypothetical protein